jgi:NADH-quinone oxidoreductase subunit H
MGADKFEIGINLLKMIIIFAMMIQAVPILVWVERRGSAYIQNRFGPNRVGPLGLMQLLADAVKFLFKEEFLPQKSVAFMYYGAPAMALIPGALALASIPLGPPIEVAAFQLNGSTQGPYTFLLQSFEINIGIVFVLGVSSLGAYALLMAGWGSANKYSLLGALRASAQMISYELALGLSLVGMILIYGTFSFSEMIRLQQGGLEFNWFGTHVTALSHILPNWGIFYNPLGMIIFAASTFAESNRLPFDLPEAEGELVAGFHTEYGGFKMLMFYIGEYGHMLVSSALLATFYFGGYGIPGLPVEALNKIMLGLVGGTTLASVLTALIFHVALLVKIGIFLWVFIWVRWTLPRFRYDQLMDLGWKTMLPWALGNTVFTAIWLFLMQPSA